MKSFNWGFRDECLDARLITSLAEARKVIEELWQGFNVLRPTSHLAE